MILSVSRRTDIPACYADWFMNRIKEGFVSVRNPMYPDNVSKIHISKDVIDCIVFWTKDAGPMIERLDELEGYQYYFQYTLNAYGKEMEPGVDKTLALENFKKLSDKIGPERVIWRYDPILLTDNYTIDWHVEQFTEYAKQLSGYTKRVVISFIDLYGKATRRTEGRLLHQLSNSEMCEIAKAIAPVAKEYGMRIESCAEKIDLDEYGIEHGHCVDKEYIEQLVGYRMIGSKDSGQRLECGCVDSIDIGRYDTCMNGCKYCYASSRDEYLRENRDNYDVNSPMLCSIPRKTDRVSVRKMRSLRRKR